jgi:hypothetical protein
MWEYGHLLSDFFNCGLLNLLWELAWDHHDHTMFVIYKIDLENDENIG